MLYGSACARVCVLILHLLCSIFFLFPQGIDIENINICNSKLISNNWISDNEMNGGQLQTNCVCVYVRFFCRHSMLCLKFQSRRILFFALSIRPTLISAGKQRKIRQSFCTREVRKTIYSPRKSIAPTVFVSYIIWCEQFNNNNERK